MGTGVLILFLLGMKRRKLWAQQVVGGSSSVRPCRHVGLSQLSPFVPWAANMLECWHQPRGNPVPEARLHPGLESSLLPHGQACLCLPASRDRQLSALPGSRLPLTSRHFFLMRFQILPP